MLELYVSSHQKLRFTLYMYPKIFFPTRFSLNILVTVHTHTWYSLFRTTVHSCVLLFLRSRKVSFPLPSPLSLYALCSCPRWCWYQWERGTTSSAFQRLLLWTVQVSPQSLVLTVTTYHSRHN